MRNLDASPRLGLWLGWLLLAVLTLVVLFTRTLTPIDETRYVAAAWEMWTRGDFLVPFKNGVPYDHKPPFFFWMFHAGWALFGVNDWWPRLVAPMFSALSLWLNFRLAQRLWPDRPGLAGAATLMLSSTMWWMLFSTATMFDVLLAFWVLVGVLGIWSAAGGRRSGFGWLGLAIGMGVLTKGPVILLHLLPLALLAPWWSPGLRGSRWAAGVVLAVLLGAAIALAWAIPAGIAGGEAYRNAIFWGQTANRMVESFAHKRPFWWYLPMLPMLLFPWLVWPGLWRALGGLRREGLDRGARFCIAWMLPVFVAFSFVSGKQLHYLIPLFPAFVLLAARALQGRTERAVWLPALGSLGLAGVLLLAALGRFGARQAELAAPPLLWPGVLLALAVLLVAWLVQTRRSAPLLPLALLSSATLGLCFIALKPSIEPLYDIRPMAQAVQQAQAQGHPVANFQKYHAQYQFPGRLLQPLAELGGDRQRQRDWLTGNPQGYAVIYFESPAGVDKLPTVYWQRYRGGAVALMRSADAQALLSADPPRADLLLD